MDGDITCHRVSGSPLLTLTVSFRGTVMRDGRGYADQ